MGKIALRLLGVIWVLGGGALLVICAYSLLLILQTQLLILDLSTHGLEEILKSAFSPYTLLLPIWLMLMISLVFGFYWAFLGVQTIRLQSWVIQGNQTFLLLLFAVWVLVLCTCVELYGRLAVKRFDDATFSQSGVVIQLLNSIFQGQMLPVDFRILLIVGGISLVPLIGIFLLSHITLQSSVTVPASNTCPICGNLLIFDAANPKGVCAHDHRRYVVAQLEFQPSTADDISYHLPLRFNPYTNHFTIGTDINQGIVIVPGYHPDLEHVAPFHVDIKLDKGRLLLQDYANQNSTFLHTQYNTIPVRAGQRVEIQNQNILVLGQANFLFHVLGYNDC